MLPLASRGAGPGPATLANWRFLVGQSNGATPRAFREARSYAQNLQGSVANTSNQSSSNRRASPSRSTPTRSRVAKSSDTLRTVTQKPQRAPTWPRQLDVRIAKPKFVTSKPSLVKLNRLTALPEGSQSLVRFMRKACEDRDDRAVIRSWERLRQIKAIDDINLYAVGRYVANIFAAPLAARQFAQDRFPHLEDMAIEAAAHDAWKGLYSLCLAAIRFGRPEMAADAFERYKLRVFKVQNKERPDGPIRDKSQRNRSRLDGHGPIPLTYTYLLAMMRLKQINGKVIMSVFETRKPIFVDSQKMIDHVLAPLLPALSKTEGPVVRREFERLIETATFVLMVWHPHALLRTMRDIDFTEDWAAMRRLYNTFLRLSIGPDKLIHAYDLDASDDVQFEEVPFTAAVWREWNHI
jgi:hypothetical protein